MKEYTVQVTSVTTVTVEAENEDEATMLACGKAWEYDADSVDGVIVGSDGEKAATPDDSDRRLLADLGAMAEKLERQAHPNKTGLAMLGCSAPPWPLWCRPPLRPGRRTSTSWRGPGRGLLSC